MNVAAGLVPVFFAMAVGFGAGKTGLIDNKHVDALNSVVMMIALPIALFTILAASERSDVVEHGAVAGAVLIVMAITYIGVYYLQRGAYQQDRPASAVQALTVAFPNTAAVGLPIADAVLGRTGELAVAVSLAVGSITLSPATITILNRYAVTPGQDRAPRPSIPGALLRSLRTPVVVAPIVGIAWSLAGLPFPAVLDTTLSELGSLTAGLALFVTGLVLSSQKLALTGNVTTSTLIGDLARPALALLVVTLLGMSGAMAQETVLLMAVPSGFFGVLLALAHRLPAGIAGPTLFYSTILSIGTLSIVILLLPAL